MTGTITLTTDNTNERIGVQLGSWAAADGPVTIKRVHPDNTEWTVRGSGSGGSVVTSGGAAFAWDYEAPFNQSVSYYAFDGATRVNSSATSLAVTYPLLRSPGLPSNDSTFTLVAKPNRKRSRPTAVLQPLGRTTSVPVFTSRAAARFTVVVETHSDQEAINLDNTLTQSGVCLLVLPGTRNPWQYVLVEDVEEQPFAPVMMSSVPGDVGTWSQWTLACTVVDPPVGGIFGDPTASYALLASSFATYNAAKLYPSYTNYLAVLKGYP